VRKGREKTVPNRVIARRSLNEVGGSLREIEVSFEEPRQDRRGHWKCRFLIKGLGRLQTRSGWCEDSPQAFLLAIEGARVALDKTGSRFTWLETHPDKAGSGIPRFIPTSHGPRFEARVNLAIERESKRYFQRILDSRKANIAAFEAEVKGRTLALLEEALVRRRDGVADLQAELKEWKPKIARETPS